MFARRRPLSVLNRARQLAWPSMGWRRAFNYLSHRMSRIPGTPYRIAAGVASGAAVSFTPFIGFHFVLAALLAVLLRANVIASALGTAIGNPWTFPLIWAWTYSCGVWILDRGNHGGPKGDSLRYIFEHPLEVLWPMTLGGVLSAVAVWGVTYVLVYRLVSEYQRARRFRLERKRRKRLKREFAAAAAEGGPEGSS